MPAPAGPSASSKDFKVLVQIQFENKQQGFIKREAILKQISSRRF